MMASTRFFCAVDKQNFVSLLHKVCRMNVFHDQHRSLAVRVDNYYDILEVSPKASQVQIKSAYYRLSKKYHPDVASSKTAQMQHKFTMLSTAYEVLGNPRSRNQYDCNVMGSSSSTGDYSTVDVEYQEFVRRRGIFKNRSHPPGTNASTMFNFDEFYRQHYGESVRQAHDDKKVKEEIKSKEQEFALYQSRLSTVYLTVVLLSFFLLMKMSP